jgi:hypothetical protein
LVVAATTKSVVDQQLKTYRVDNLADFENCCKMRIWLQNFVSIQPRTSCEKSDLSAQTAAEDLENSLRDLGTSAREGLARHGEQLSAMQRGMHSVRNDLEELTSRVVAAEASYTASVTRLEEREIKQMGESVSQIRKAVGTLAMSLSRIGQVLGLLPDDDRREVTVRDLLDWEATGQSIGARVDKSWWSRSQVKQKTVIEILQQKADASGLKQLQMAIRDLDLRVSGAGGTRGGMSTPQPIPSTTFPSVPVEPRSGGTTPEDRADFPPPPYREVRDPRAVFMYASPSFLSNEPGINATTFPYNWV